MDNCIIDMTNMAFYINTYVKYFRKEKGKETGFVPRSILCLN